MTHSFVPLTNRPPDIGCTAENRRRGEAGAADCGFLAVANFSSAAESIPFQGRIAP